MPELPESYMRTVSTLAYTRVTDSYGNGIPAVCLACTPFGLLAGFEDGFIRLFDYVGLRLLDEHRVHDYAPVIDIRWQRGEYGNTLNDSNISEHSPASDRADSGWPKERSVFVLSYAADSSLAILLVGKGGFGVHSGIRANESLVSAALYPLLQLGSPLILTLSREKRLTALCDDEAYHYEPVATRDELTCLAVSEATQLFGLPPLSGPGVPWSAAAQNQANQVSIILRSSEEKAPSAKKTVPVLLAVGTSRGEVLLYSYSPDVAGFFYRGAASCRNKAGKYSSGCAVTGIEFVESGTFLLVSTMDSRVRLLRLTLVGPSVRESSRNSLRLGRSGTVDFLSPQWRVTCTPVAKFKGHSNSGEGSSAKVSYVSGNAFARYPGGYRAFPVHVAPYKSVVVSGSLDSKLYCWTLTTDGFLSVGEQGLVSRAGSSRSASNNTSEISSAMSDSGSYCSSRKSSLAAVHEALNRASGFSLKPPVTSAAKTSWMGSLWSSKPVPEKLPSRENLPSRESLSLTQSQNFGPVSHPAPSIISHAPSAVSSTGSYKKKPTQTSRDSTQVVPYQEQLISVTHIDLPFSRLAEILRCYARVRLYEDSGFFMTVVSSSLGGIKLLFHSAA